MGVNWKSQFEKTTLKPVTHILFDMDGLLINTEIIYTKTIETIVSKYRGFIELPWKVKKMQLGRIAPDLAQLIIDEYSLPLKPWEYTAQALKIQEGLFPECTLMPGAERLIRHLKTHNIPIAVATSSPSETFRMKSTNHKEFFKMFDHIVCGSSDPEVKRGKPAPDVFLVCANRFLDTPSPEKCLVFEDAPNGVAAARAGGMQVVMVPDPRMEEEEKEKATLCIKSLEDFQPELFGLPPI